MASGLLVCPDAGGVALALCCAGAAVVTPGLNETGGFDCPGAKVEIGFFADTGTCSLTGAAVVDVGSIYVPTDQGTDEIGT